MCFKFSSKLYGQQAAMSCFIFAAHLE